MRLLFELDAKDYKKDGTIFSRPSSRAIIIKDNKIFMVHSLLYDYYKFPGGGINLNESKIDALIRETKEEAGLTIIPSKIKEYGLVRRIEKDNIGKADIYLQENYYYIVEVEDTISNQILDEYEAKEKFTLEYIDYKTALKANKKKDHGPKDPLMILREAKVLELLVKEGYLE